MIAKVRRHIGEANSVMIVNLTAPEGVKSSGKPVAKMDFRGLKLKVRIGGVAEKSPRQIHRLTFAGLLADFRDDLLVAGPIASLGLFLQHQAKSIEVMGSPFQGDRPGLS